MAYSSINKCKWGNCSVCNKQDTEVVKVAKNLVCLYCRKNQKAKIQLEKQKERNKIRQLIITPQNLESKKSSTLGKWFEERRAEMTNVCVECGRQTNKGNDKYFIWSICHIVPKSLVKSVATNEFNFIELCQLHHQEYDNSFERAAKMMCFGEIKAKFQLFKHLIPAEELRKVNPHLL